MNGVWTHVWIFIFTCIVRKLRSTFSVSFFSEIVQDGNFIVFLEIMADIIFLKELF